MRWGYGLLLVVVLVAWRPDAAFAPVPPVPTHELGPGSIIAPGADLIGFANLQGGYCDDQPPHACHVNLDIGAGSTANPGNIVLNYDVGKDVLIYDGRKHLIATFSGKGIAFYRTPKLKRQRP